MEYKRKKSGPKSAYSDSFRRKVVEEILSGSIHMAGAVRKYGLKGSGTLTTWKRWYEKNHDIVPKQELMQEQEPEQGASEPIKDAQVQALQDALKLAELKIAALQTLIDKAEDHYKIAIRKNSGTKQ
jgi:transposase-like protein